MVALPEGAAARLVAAAKNASRSAYCPYSGFPVGAAVLTESGEVFAGCNIENASYGASMCAERIAIFTAVAAGARQAIAIAIYTPTPVPTMPCGLCRQVLIEFGPSAAVHCACDGPGLLTLDAGELLPRAFSRRDLQPGA